MVGTLSGPADEISARAQQFSRECNSRAEEEGRVFIIVLLLLLLRSSQYLF